MKTLSTLSGLWYENEQVTVQIGEDIITRKVRFNRVDGLYIIYKGYKMFMSDFDAEEVDMTGWNI